MMHLPVLDGGSIDKYAVTFLTVFQPHLSVDDVDWLIRCEKERYEEVIDITDICARYHVAAIVSHPITQKILCRVSAAGKVQWVSSGTKEKS